MDISAAQVVNQNTGVAIQKLNDLLNKNASKTETDAQRATTHELLNKMGQIVDQAKS